MERSACRVPFRLRSPRFMLSDSNSGITRDGRGMSVSFLTETRSEGQGTMMPINSPMSRAPRIPDGSGEIGLSDLVRILRRRVKIILAAVILILVLGALYCVLKTRRYE